MVRTPTTRFLLSTILILGVAISAAAPAAQATPREREGRAAECLERQEARSAQGTWLERFLQMLRVLAPGSMSTKEGAAWTSGGTP